MKSLTISELYELEELHPPLVGSRTQVIRDADGRSQDLQKPDQNQLKMPGHQNAVPKTQTKKKGKRGL